MRCIYSQMALFIGLVTIMIRLMYLTIAMWLWKQSLYGNRACMKPKESFWKTHSLDSLANVWGIQCCACKLLRAWCYVLEGSGRFWKDLFWNCPWLFQSIVQNLFGFSWASTWVWLRGEKWLKILVRDKTCHGSSACFNINEAYFFYYIWFPTWSSLMKQDNSSWRFR